MAGIRQILKKDTVLRELAETPLFLSIMTLAYRDRPSKDILVSEDLELQRKLLFDTYIDQMFDRVARTKKELYTPEQTKRWLALFAR